MKKIESKKTTIGFILVLLLLSLLGAQQAQAAWTSKENARVKALEDRIKELEILISQKSASYEMKTIRYLVSEPDSGLLKDICPGIENLDGGRDFSYIGRLSPRLDILGRPVVGINGESITYPVYRCKMTFWVPKL